MTVTIDITSDIDEALRDVDDFFESQVPFVVAGALTDTAFDVRRRIVGSTWQEAFQVRNRALPGRAMKVMDDTGGVLRGGARTTTRALKSHGTVSISVGDIMNLEWSERQATGGVKKARGGTIAVPVNGNALRGVSGRVLKRNLPMNITNKKRFFLMKKGGRKHAIMERKGDSMTAVYLFMEQANIPKHFRFYEDAEATALRVFSGHVDNRLSRVIKSSRFFPS